jgi:hypothetical protein
MAANFTSLRSILDLFPRTPIEVKKAHHDRRLAAHSETQTDPGLMVFFDSGMYRINTKDLQTS